MKDLLFLSLIHDCQEFSCENYSDNLLKVTVIISDTVLWKCFPTIYLAEAEENDVYDVEVVIAHVVIIARTWKEGADQGASRAKARLFHELDESYRMIHSGALYT